MGCIFSVKFSKVSEPADTGVCKHALRSVHNNVKLGRLMNVPV